MAVPIFTYRGNDVTFQRDGGAIMVNATEMAKPFGKRPVDWFALPSTERFLYELGDVRKSDITLIDTVKGNYSDGRSQGTWMHEDVALEFARWLSPAFAIWCNDRIKELLKVGMTALPHTVEAMLNNPDLIIGLATQLKEERLRVESLTQDIMKLGVRTLEQKKALDEAAPKALFADAVNASQSSILIRELAKLINQNGVEIGEKRLFDWLRNNEYLCRVGESRNLPTQRSMDQGLMEIKKTTRIAPNGTIFTDSTPKITGKGCVYFVNKFLYENK